MWKLTLGVAVAAGMATASFVATDVQAQDDGVWWPAKVEIYNPSCTDGDPACWTDPANQNLDVVDYVPLMPDEVDAKHHICVSFPHLVDSYWVGAAYGIIEEGTRLGQKISLIEAGGYDKLEKQLSQVEDCIANGAEILVLSAISAEGNIKQVNELRARGIPIVDLINGINTEVDAKSLESYYSMGRIACKWIADQHPAGSGVSSWPGSRDRPEPAGRSPATRAATTQSSAPTPRSSRPSGPRPARRPSSASSRT